ncbi:DUF1801 domain-containing protein [Confluentibacter sediminis]|uniref:DUF1801 domain-containing protein n=1 Tax=Confluentibacter sediminis TaxID=2219045 RepID=UPI000DAEB185|nr:DUF1801 domain-containing protein [Confluentibacter sediminis]
MNQEIAAYNDLLEFEECQICDFLAVFIYRQLPEVESKICHKHPVWFIEENPIVGYSKLKKGIRLMFWSGASFNEEQLELGTGKFKDASILYTSLEQINHIDLERWIEKARNIQWDYKNMVKRKGRLERLK